MNMPDLIVEDLRVILAKQRRISPKSVVETQIRIFARLNPDVVRELMEKHVAEPEEPVQSGWDQKMVKRALIDAFDMLRRTEGRVGPSQLKAAHIEISDSWGYVDNEEWQRGRPNPRDFNASGMNASRMEMIVVGTKHIPDWLAMVEDRTHRTKLAAWVMAKLTGRSMAVLCRKRKWAERTFRRDVLLACQEIADRLNRECVEVF